MSLGFGIIGAQNKQLEDIIFGSRIYSECIWINSNSSFANLASSLDFSQTLTC